MNMTVREFIDRYGPTLAVILTLVVLVAVLPGNVDGASTDLGASADETGTGGTTADGTTSDGGGVGTSGGGIGSAGGNSGAGGGTGGSATVGGGERVGSTSSSGPETPDGCRSDGLLTGFSLYMPPCVPVFRGDNGGATYQGVTKDSILVVRYMAQIDPATQAVIRGFGADDGRAKNDDIDATAFRYWNTHAETYGREVKMVTFDGTGPMDDDQAVRRDAVTIATRFKPFAVIYMAPAQPVPAFTEEIASRGILCICTTSYPRSFYKDHAPFVFSQLPVLDEYFLHLAEYIGKRLANKPAKFAGDLPPTLKTQNRKFGLIYVNGQKGTVDPRVDPVVDFYGEELAKYGVGLTRKASYTFDLTRQQEQATNLIAQMKSSGVSNLLCVCDPIYPVFLTNEATRQQYFPEWLIPGTGLIDSTFFGRKYDQSQWQHAFGIGPLWVLFTDVRTSAGYRAYHHMNPGASHGDEGAAVNLRHVTVQTLFVGISAAGPRLTPRTFADGMYRLPRIGGAPKFPLVYYTPDSPTSVKDFTEVFWDTQQTGKDEVGRDGVGALLKADGGKRYQAGQWPREDPKVFTRDGAVFTSDTPPESYDHDRDGHRHPASQRCRSCA